MALTESTMLSIGTPAPAFTLPDTVSDQDLSWADLKGPQGTLVYFICNHCPYVLHVIEELVQVAKDYANRGIATVAISANDAEKYPVDSPDNMQAFAANFQFSFPYLYDESQEVARSYDAACTPDIYLFDANAALYYRGRLDANRPGSGTPPTGEDLRHALDDLLAGQPSPEKQYPSAGCNIKWKG
ncbi:thioredoxin family protein [Neolewinella lacunae]|uniref:Thioredoxin family protein n=1 Tax=Neolewinella lacunae TaxID=1517758 RepID=A0A923PLM3_9BACT|nr:thioredoxin family protein [Neolewinella lacunae]MBC6994986.1 thioredoxin family protein [Neolewinella lacunae]MDN3633243.1 thioredoxin family protein [Neolewinella lacunae]